MKLGITGHQDRLGIDWDWVRAEIEREVGIIPHPFCGLSSLAKGADQTFARVVLELGGHLISIIPMDGYERYFEGEALARYWSLRGQSRVVCLHGTHDQGAFLNAGKYVADNCDLLLAVWDAQPSKGKGGTADVVEYAQHLGKNWIHIDPMTKMVIRHVRTG